MIRSASMRWSMVLVAATWGCGSSGTSAGGSPGGSGGHSIEPADSSGGDSEAVGGNATTEIPDSYATAGSAAGGGLERASGGSASEAVAVGGTSGGGGELAGSGGGLADSGGGGFAGDGGNGPIGEGGFTSSGGTQGGAAQNGGAGQANAEAGAGGSVASTIASGTWLGTTSQGQDIKFEVAPSGLVVTKVIYNWIALGCGAIGVTSTTGTFAISGAAFSVKGGFCPSAAINGTFTNSTSATGSLSLTFSGGAGCSCSGSIKLTWDAHAP